jgi:ATP-binding cassette subfamily F protein uup
LVPSAAKASPENIWLSFYPDAKIGVVGVNGSGKSSLLKIMAGIDKEHLGEAQPAKNIKIGYLPQEPALDAQKNVLENVEVAVARTKGLLKRFDEVNAKLGDPDLDPAAMDKLLEEQGKLQDGIEAANGWDLDRTLEIAMDALRCPPPETPVKTLSGGERRRVALCRLLLQRPDLLLLDEPTNHLDLPGVVWLERLLRAAPFGYLVATHDRAFLRATADETLEVSRVYPGGAFRVAGPFDDFADRREEFLEAQARQQEAVANQVRRETEWLGRKAAARTRKASSRIEAAANRREELDELKYRNAAAGAAGIDFVATGRQTRKLLTVAGISKSVGEKENRPLFSNLDLLLTPGMKLGLLGPNGSGKSTLLRILAGLMRPTGGSTRLEVDGATLAGTGRRNEVGLATPELAFYEEFTYGEPPAGFATVVAALPLALGGRYTLAVSGIAYGTFRFRVDGVGKLQKQ